MANQISYFNVKYMTVGACANFHTTVVKYITATTPQILHIENKIEAYREKVRQLKAIGAEGILVLTLDKIIP